MALMSGGGATWCSALSPAGSCQAPAMWVPRSGHVGIEPVRNSTSVLCTPMNDEPSGSNGRARLSERYPCIRLPGWSNSTKVVLCIVLLVVRPRLPSHCCLRRKRTFNFDPTRRGSSFIRAREFHTGARIGSALSQPQVSNFAGIAPTAKAMLTSSGCLLPQRKTRDIALWQSCCTTWQVRILRCGSVRIAGEYAWHLHIRTWYSARCPGASRTSRRSHFPAKGVFQC